jgi:guanyl-specific ribonuclease Sa
MRQVLSQPGASAALRLKALVWGLPTQSPSRLDDSEFATWLAGLVRRGALGYAVVADHAIAAGQLEPVEKMQAAVVRRLEQVAHAKPGPKRGRSLIAAAAPSEILAAGQNQEAGGQQAGRRQGGAPRLSPQQIQTMPIEERLIEVLHRAMDGNLLSAEVRQQLEEILDPAAIASTVAVLALWAGSHAVGIGFFVDLLVVALGVASVGAAAVEGVKRLMEFLQLTATARESSDFDRAAEMLAAAIALLGVTVLMRMIARGAVGVRGWSKQQTVAKNTGSQTRSTPPREGVEQRPATPPPVPKKPIPQKAKDTAEHVKRTGSPPAGHTGGRKFKNHEGRLPPGGSYKEYDVDPGVPGQPRNAERIVVDTNTGKVWYTDDHYSTFHEM